MFATYNPAPAFQAHATMRINAEKATGQKAAAIKAWATMRANKAKAREIALRAVDTRLQNEGAFN